MRSDQDKEERSLCLSSTDEHEMSSPPPSQSNHNVVAMDGECAADDNGFSRVVLKCDESHIDSVDIRRTHHESRNNGSVTDGDDSSLSNSKSVDIPNPETDESHSTNGDNDSIYSDDESDDMSLGFPPGHITRMDELNVLQNHNSRHLAEKNNSVNPSIIPSYFFCPLTKMIMKDPVITPDGHTYERRAILRHLILENCDPTSRNPLSHDELTDDYLVKQAIQKAREEAWIRYVIECQDERNAAPNTDKSCRDITTDKMYHYTMQESVRQPTTSSLSTLSPSSGNCVLDNHGWTVPLGVHKIICSQPGLVVTTDIHRRSSTVKRKIVLKSLVAKKADAKIIMNHPFKRKKTKQKLKTITTVITRDLILPPGSYVDVLETCVYDGRVRGRILWEEELKTENDLALSMRLAELELKKDTSTVHHTRSSNSPKKGKNVRSFLQRKLSGSHNWSIHDEKKETSRTLLSDESPTYDVSSVATIEYTGWISLQWEKCSMDNKLEDSTKRQTIPQLIADEDDGPWSEPLPLGVYRVCCDSSRDDTFAGNHDVGISARQLPIFDAPDCANHIDFLLPNQVIETVEMKVLVMKENGLNAISAGRQVVCAKCVVPAIEVSKNQNTAVSISSTPKLRHGWIVIRGEGKILVPVSPISLGAYIVTSNDSLHVMGLSDANGTVKSMLPHGSCIEVVNTRIELEDDDKMMTCGCGRAGLYRPVSVRALIASGGYVTLFSTSIGADGVCMCGNLVQSVIYADPVPLGTYRMIHPTTVTKQIDPQSAVIARLAESSCVEVIETKVERGCVRGLINTLPQRDEDSLMCTGWVCLFEPPSFSWAELIVSG